MPGANRPEPVSPVGFANSSAALGAPWLARFRALAVGPREGLSGAHIRPAVRAVSGAGARVASVFPPPEVMFVLVLGVRRRPSSARAGRADRSWRALEEPEILLLRHELSILRRQVARLGFRQRIGW